MEVFAIRDEAYLQRMEKELASENGTCTLLYDDDWFIGMQSEWGLKEREMRYLYTGEHYRVRAGAETGDHGEDRLHAGVCDKYPPLRRLLSGRGDSGDRDQRPLRSSESGAWLWHLTKHGSRMTQESRFIAKGQDGGPDDLGTHGVVVRIPDAGSGKEDPIWGIYRAVPWSVPGRSRVIPDSRGQVRSDIGRICEIVNG